MESLPGSLWPIDRVSMYSHCYLFNGYVPGQAHRCTAINCKSIKMIFGAQKAVQQVTRLEIYFRKH